MTNTDNQSIVKLVNRPELFTRHECETILKTMLADQSQKGNLKEFRVVPAMQNIGYLGEYHHLILDYQLENETEQHTRRLFVKSANKSVDKSFYDQYISISRKEAQLYGLLLNDLQKFSTEIWCAKSYFNRDDLFVMQNIEDLGYGPLPAETGFLSEEQLRPMLKALATLHACSVAYERRHKVTIGVKFRKWLFEVSIDPEIDWWTTGIKAVLAVAATHPRVQNDAAAQDYIANELPRCMDRIYFMAKPSPVHRNVFLHRDPWGGNVFYHRERVMDVGCILVDFQLCAYAPPVLDFLMAIYLNLEPKERKNLMPSLTSHYHGYLLNALTSMGIDAEREQLSWVHFEQSLEDFALFGAIYNCISATFLRLPDNYLKKLKDDKKEEYNHFCNVDRTIVLRSLMKQHKEFTCYIYDCIEDLLELTYYKQAA